MRLQAAAIGADSQLFAPNSNARVVRVIASPDGQQPAPRAAPQAAVAAVPDGQRQAPGAAPQTDGASAESVTDALVACERQRVTDALVACEAQRVTDALVACERRVVVTDYAQAGKFPDEYLRFGTEPDDGDPADPSDGEPKFAAFVTKQLPKGAKKRLSRITDSLRDVFATGVECLRKQFGAGASDEAHPLPDVGTAEGEQPEAQGRPRIWPRRPATRCCYFQDCLGFPCDNCHECHRQCCQANQHGNVHSAKCHRCAALICVQCWPGHQCWRHWNDDAEETGGPPPLQPSDDDDVQPSDD